MSNVTSQSELTTKEIVEQAISDYHESILPFLNGMVPTIANKFNKSDLLSYDEKIVGCAPDGKPLYQNTINLGNSFSNGSNEILHNISNIDMVWDMWGTLKYTSGSISPLPRPDDNANGMIIINGITSTSINLWFGSNRYSNVSSSQLTILYTKTTDEAIAIGSDTDYSLEEKIVGTWIDGKPLYQKTFVQTGGIRGNTIYFAQDFANMDYVSKKAVTFKLNNNTYSSEYCTRVDDVLQALVTSGGVYTIIANRTVSEMYVTVEYTKTTDV